MTVTDARELRRRLSDLWATLDAMGARVDRRPLDRLSARQLRILCAEAGERARVLSSPEAAAHVARARTRRGSAA